jgi:DNA topoisomerase-1
VKNRARKTVNKKCEAKWKTLEHNGVIFPPEYEYLSIPLLYGIDKTPIILNPEAEEAAMFYAKILHLEHSSNPTFKKNFFADWKKLLPRNSQIKSLEECDFKNFRDIIEEETAARKQMTKSQKGDIKDRKDQNEAKYKTAIVDGKKQNVGNFRIEPPGLFLGRGKHPKAGKIKRRVQPEDIIINIGESASIPQPPDGHEWGQVIHDHCSVWLASWKENINNDTKYVWLGQDADFKAHSDEAKFELARKLKENFSEIRSRNMENIEVIGSSKEADRLNQLATAVYLIDTLVLRVGNEKGSDEADTVGVSSLRVEHIDLKPNSMVKLDFLGKDSIRFEKTFEVPSSVYKMLKIFTNGKKKTDALFNMINAKDINQYLKELMPGLTAKVFRTANASNLYQDQLDKIKYKRGEKSTILVNKINKANADVAIMCNHKKKVARGYTAGIEKINQQIKTLETKLKNIKRKRRSRAVDKQIKTKKEKIKELKTKLNTKKHMKEVATGTAKINYIDPRIAIAFAKRHDIDISKLYNRQQQNKFAWAINVGPRWKF